MKIKIEVENGDIIMCRIAEGNYGVWEAAEENLGKLHRAFSKVEHTGIEDNEEHDCHASPEDGCEVCEKQLEG